MTARNFLGWTFCVALVVQVIAGFILPGKELTMQSGPRLIGGALVYTAFPALILLVGKLFRTKSMIPYYIAGGLFASVAALMVGGKYYERYYLGLFSPYVFSPSGCDFAVTFPSRPKIDSSGKGASLAQAGTILQAYCVASTKDSELNAEKIRKDHQFVLRMKRMQEIETNTVRRAQWVEVTSTAVMNIKGKTLGFRHRVLRRKHSFMMLIGSGPFSKLFSPRIVKFLDSGRLKP